MDVKVIGIDIAKRYFQVHAVSSSGAVVIRRKLPRSRFLEALAGLSPCLVGLEAGSGAHHWARELTRLGHEVKLMPPQYVRPYVKTNKHDSADAEACCEAVQRPGMRFVPVKSVEQQTAMALHRVRDHLIRQRTGTIVWPSLDGSHGADGKVHVTPAQLSMLLEGIDWRMPARTWRPLSTG